VRKRQKILWIPHAPWERIDGQRECHLINELKSRHDIHVLTWSYNRLHKKSYFFHPRYYLDLFSRSSLAKDGITLHHIPTLPNLTNFFAVDKSYPFFINTWIFQKSLESLHREEKFDVVICGTIQWMFGELPSFPGAEVIFDYLDAFHEWQLERIAKKSNAVMCVSNYLLKQASPHYQRKLYSPNGVYLERFRETDDVNLRESLGLTGKKVISLIGLTCSSRFYFLDAIKELQEEFSDVVFLAVGSGAAKAPLEAHAKKIGLRYVGVSQVPSAQVARYFSITDIGIYPGEKNAVYDAACPIKVMEYSAAKKPVVSSVTWELNHLKFPNVFLTEPDADSFLAGLKSALAYRGEFPDMEPYSWQNISRELERFASPSEKSENS
jgi:glycosyltransferase involved in cell wall biosynthesis